MMTLRLLLRSWATLLARAPRSCTVGLASGTDASAVGSSPGAGSAPFEPSRIATVTRGAPPSPGTGLRRISAGNREPSRRRADSRRSTPSGRGPGPASRSATSTSIEVPTSSGAGQPNSCSARASTFSMRPPGSTSMTASGPAARASSPAARASSPAWSRCSTSHPPVLPAWAAPSRRATPAHHYGTGPHPRTCPRGATSASPRGRSVRARTVGAQGWAGGVRCHGALQLRGGGCHGTSGAADRGAVSRGERVRRPARGTAGGCARRARLRGAQRAGRRDEPTGERALRVRARRAARRRGRAVAAGGHARSTRRAPCRVQPSPPGAVDGLRPAARRPAPRRVGVPRRGEPGAMAGRWAGLGGRRDSRRLRAAGDGGDDRGERAAPAPDRREREPGLHPPAAGPAGLPLRQPKGPSASSASPPSRPARRTWRPPWTSCTRTTGPRCTLASPPTPLRGAPPFPSTGSSPRTGR